MENFFESHLITNFIEKANDDSFSDNFKLAAGILRGKKLYGKICTNSYRSTFSGNNNFSSLHAEAAAMISLFGKKLNWTKKLGWCYTGDKRKNKKLSILVIRLGSDNHLSNARPCYHCLKMAKQLNIGFVYYSTGHQNLIRKEKVRDMISINLSSSNLRIACNHISKKKANNLHFLKMMKDNLPLKMKKKNFDSFVKYNLSILFENIQIIKNEKNLYIIIIKVNKCQYKFNLKVIN